MPLFNPPAASAGASALDANGNLVLPVPSAATVPAAGTIAERVITRAGFAQLGYANPDVPDLLAMPSLENYSVSKLEATGSTTPSTTNCSTNITAGLGIVLRAYTTYTTSKDYIALASGSTAGSGAYLTASVPPRTRGNAARRGGFDVVIRFNPVLLAGHQAKVGLGSASGVTFTSEPSVDNEFFVGMACDSTDTTWQLLSSAASTGTKINTTLTKISTGAMIALYLYAVPNGTGVAYQIENEETQTVVASGTMTGTLPPATQTLSSAGFRIRNGATTTVAQINVNSVYVASRY